MLCHLGIGIKWRGISDVRVALPRFGNHVGLANGKIPILGGRKLNRFDFDLGNSLLVGHVQQSLIFDEIVSVDADDEAWVQLRFLPIQIMGAFHFASRNAVQNGKDMFASEPGVLLDSSCPIPTCAGNALIVDDHVVKNFSLLTFTEICPIVGLEHS
jgi:hypothetical protein